MSDKSSGSGGGSVWVVFLVLGMTFNTLGITLRSLGWARYVMMGAGLALLLTAVVLALRDARSRS
ncbi:MAG TPA: hypothetical protein VF263_25435 [Longimicrobiaceae bacterium]